MTNPFAETAQPTCTPVLTVGATYVTGDYVGTSGVAMVFEKCTPEGLGGYIHSAELIDGSGATGIAFELWLFDSAVTPPADSAAWTISDADAKKLVAIIPFAAADYYASALNCACDGTPKSGPKKFVSQTAGNLYGCAVARGSWGGTSLDLTFRLTVLPGKYPG